MWSCALAKCSEVEAFLYFLKTKIEGAKSIDTLVQILDVVQLFMSEHRAKVQSVNYVIISGVTTLSSRVLTKLQDDFNKLLSERTSGR